MSSLVFDLSDTQIDQSLGFIARVWQGFKLFLPVNVETFPFFFLHDFILVLFAEMLFTDVLSLITYYRNLCKFCVKLCSIFEKKTFFYNCVCTAKRTPRGTYGCLL